jgi:hypothetical protein
VNRKAAMLVWTSTLLVPLFFAAMADSVRFGSRHLPQGELFFWLSVAVSTLFIALSRALPPRVRAMPAGREATAFIRLTMAWALCEGVALLALVAWILTDDPRQLGVCAVDLLALTILFPSQSRWAGALPPEPSAGRR